MGIVVLLLPSLPVVHIQKYVGKIAVYAFDTPDAFRRLGGAGSGINDPYVDGVSITHGDPRNHVWTYAAAYIWHP